MRFRLIHQIHKSLHSTGGSSSSSSVLSRARSPVASQPSVMCTTKSSLSMQQRQRVALLQKQLISDYNTVRIARVSFGVELCNAMSAILLDGTADPNLPRGWDAGVDVDDDGG